MEENNNTSVPYIVYEGEQARHERTVKRLIAIIIIAIILVFASNAAWLYAWMQYDYVRVLDRIERQLGTKTFRTLFKSITVDNGTENQDYIGLEKSIRNKKARTKIYYCHPYTPSERGSNENQNRLIRRFVPKGANIGEYSSKDIKEIERWMNRYPRKLFGWKTAGELFREECLNAIGYVPEMFAV